METSTFDLKSLPRRLIRKFLGIKPSPQEVFGSERFRRINQKRLEHLASLGLNLEGLSVLEVGAGIGDHTNFFLDRGCRIVSTDGRQEHLKILKSRHPSATVRYLDLDRPNAEIQEMFDIIYCYGLLYHLKYPAQAIEFMSRWCRKILLIETCVAFGDGEFLKLDKETPNYPSTSTSGYSSRPTRKWVYSQLKRHFDFVYLPITQPNHEEFPIDWTIPPPKKAIIRAVFIASRERLNNRLLSVNMPLRQVRL